MVELRTFCDSEHNNPALKSYLLTEAEWIDVMELKDILEPFKKYTTKLQSDDCTLSDFYGFWIRLRMRIEKGDHILKTNILHQMDRRQAVLISSPALLGAVYLDPRYQRFLKSEQKNTARVFLSNIHRRLKAIHTNVSTPQQPADANDGSIEDSLEELLAHYGDDGSRPSLENNQQNSRSIEILLQEFDGQRERLKSSVLDFWTENKNLLPELFQISEAVFAISPTQTSVERAFSSIPIILTSHRTSLGDNSLQNILFIRANAKHLNTD